MGRLPPKTAPTCPAGNADAVRQPEHEEHVPKKLCGAYPGQARQLANQAKAEQDKLDMEAADAARQLARTHATAEQDRLDQAAKTGGDKPDLHTQEGRRVYNRDYRKKRIQDGTWKLSMDDVKKRAKNKAKAEQDQLDQEAADAARQLARTQAQTEQDRLDQAVNTVTEPRCDLIEAWRELIDARRELIEARCDLGDAR